MNVTHPFEGTGPHCRFCGLAREDHSDNLMVFETTQGDTVPEGAFSELNYDRSEDRQPTPTAPLEEPMIVDLVKADLDARREQGIRKYGQALRTNNGRDPLLDLYGELIDAGCYCRQLIEERNS